MLMAETVAPATNEPLGSVIAPFSVAVEMSAWAKTAAQAHNITAKALRGRKFSRINVSPKK
jgi:hypothetical protein